VRSHQSFRAIKQHVFSACCIHHRSQISKAQKIAHCIQKHAGICIHGCISVYVYVLIYIQIGIIYIYTYIVCIHIHIYTPTPTDSGSSSKASGSRACFLLFAALLPARCRLSAAYCLLSAALLPIVHCRFCCLLPFVCCSAADRPLLV